MAQFYSLCLAFLKPWVQSLEPYKMDMVAHVMLTLRKWRQEDEKFRVILGYVRSPRPAWAVRLSWGEDCSINTHNPKFTAVTFLKFTFLAVSYSYTSYSAIGTFHVRGLSLSSSSSLLFCHYFVYMDVWPACVYLWATLMLSQVMEARGEGQIPQNWT